MNFKKGEVLFFNKPLGWTSFKVVGHVRYHICRRIGVKKLKVGHAGTLDPLATGVMILCTGKATKRIEEFQYHTKEYVATLRLGATTPSYDLEHEIDATYPTGHITRELVEETLTHFLGAIEQVPPAFSACMVEYKSAVDKYLDACLEEDPGDGSVVRAALNDIARAQGMTQLARETGISREGLYKALSPSGNPEFATVLKIIKALKIKLHASSSQDNLAAA